MIFLVIVPCVLCFVYAWRRRQKYLEGKLPPAAFGEWPIVGHLHLWMRGPFSAPEDFAKVVNTSDEKAFLIDDSIRAIFGEGLNSAPVWQNHRKILEPIFAKLCNLVVINLETKILIDKFNEKPGKGPFDQLEFLQQTVMRILFTIIFGARKHEISEGTIDRYKNVIEKISDILFKRYESFIMHNKLFFSYSRLKQMQDACVNDIKGITNQIITSKREEIKNRTADNITAANTATCLLDELLQLESKGLYSEQQVSDEVITMLFGGYQTLAYALTFALAMVGSYPEVQDKVYLEITNSLDKTKWDLTTEDLKSLEYLDAVVMETLRLYPVISMVTRTVIDPIEIKKYSLEPGAQCLLFLYGMNRHPSWGHQREEFRPERWLESSLPDHACSAFGIGRRSCIGMKLALNIMKTILAHLIREYKITSDHTKMIVTQKLMLTPTSGYYISLERRMTENKLGS